MREKGTVLITGGAGYVGSHIGFYLASKGYKIVVLDRQKEQLLVPNWAEVVTGDYGDSDLLKKLLTEFKIDSVVHCASLTSVALSVQQPLAYYENNVSKTVTLLKALVEHNVKSLVFSSSCAVYGNPVTVPLRETQVLSPVSPYGTTKMIIEQLLKECSIAHGLEFVSLRYFNVTGSIDGAQFGKSRPGKYVIPLLLDAARSGAPFYLFGQDYSTPDGTCIRDYIHVRDVADAHYKALIHLKEGKPSDIFNIGSGHGWSVKQLIIAAQKITQKEIDVIPAARRPGEPAALVADAGKATDLLGWRPNFSNLDYCIETVWKQSELR